MVRSPVIRSFPAPTCSTFFDLNVIVGYLATSKKWSLRKSLSRSGTRVSTEATSIVTSTEDFAMSLSSNCTVPLTFVNAPRTVEIARWRTANCAAEWFGSICQVEVAVPAGSESAAANAVTEIARVRNWPIIFLLCTAIRLACLSPTAKFSLAAFRADRIQQIRQGSYACGRHMRELPLVELANRRIEALQQFQSAARDSRLNHAPIVTLPLPRDHVALFHAVQ